MNNYRVSGFIEEIGATQVDIEARNKSEARVIAEEKYYFYKITNVTEL